MKTKLMRSGIQSCWAIVLDWISVDSIFLDLVVRVIFCFKHGVETSLIIILLANLTLKTSTMPSYRSILKASPQSGLATKASCFNMQMRTVGY